MTNRYLCSAVINEIKESKKVDAKTEKQAWFLFCKEYGFKNRDFKCIMIERNILGEELEEPIEEVINNDYEDFKKSPEHQDWEAYQIEETKLEEENKMADKFYGFTNSKKVWSDWNECLAETKGKQGYSKKFGTWVEAAKFSGITADELTAKIDAKMEETKQIIKPTEDKKQRILPNDVPQIFVDGSFYNGKYSWAYVVMLHGKVLHQAAGVGNNPDAATMNNVAGELSAAMRGAKWAKDNNIKAVIYHDYQGISSWVDGSWKTKNEFTKKYKEFMNNYTDTIAFFKVAGHTGVEGNELADKLAKHALGL